VNNLKSSNCINF